MSVYLDEMFLFNAVMDYILLRLCASVCLSGFRKHRMILASVLGGVSACIGYVFRLPFVFGLIFAALCCFAAFGFVWKECVVLCILSACYSGCLKIISGLIGTASRNGFGYIEFSPILLIGLSVILYVPIKFCFFLYNKKNSKHRQKAMIITKDGTIKLTVLIDSGCMLSCGGNPVMIVSNKLFSDSGEIPVPYTALGGGGSIMCRYMSGFVGDRFYGKIAVGAAEVNGDGYQGIFPQYAL